MPQDPVDRPRVLAAAPVSGSRVGGADPAVTLPGVAAVRSRLRLPRLSVRAQSVVGRSGLGALILCSFAVVAFTTSHASVLVPRSYQIFPNWDAGPLHGLLGRLPNDPLALKISWSGV